MILVTRLNGDVFALNPDLFERIEAHPDTVITLVDDTHYVVREPFDEVLARITVFRAEVMAEASRQQAAQPLSARDLHLAVVPTPPEDIR